MSDEIDVRDALRCWRADWASLRVGTRRAWLAVLVAAVLGLSWGAHTQMVALRRSDALQAARQAQWDAEQTADAQRCRQGAGVPLYDKAHLLTGCAPLPSAMHRGAWRGR